MKIGMAKTRQIQKWSRMSRTIALMSPPLWPLAWAVDSTHRTYASW